MKLLGVSVTDQSQSLIGQNRSILYYRTIPVCWSIPGGVQAYIPVRVCMNVLTCFECWNEKEEARMECVMDRPNVFHTEGPELQRSPVTPAQCSACDRDTICSPDTHTHTLTLTRRGCQTDRLADGGVWGHRGPPGIWKESRDTRVTQRRCRITAHAKSVSGFSAHAHTPGTRIVILSINQNSK